MKRRDEFRQGRQECLRHVYVALIFVCCAQAGLGPQFTPPASGPYQVRGNRILDSQGRPYLIRGTELPTLTLTDSPSPSRIPQLGPFSASALVTIRQRMNMNAVRLPLNALEYNANPRYRARAREVVREANRFQLLVILAEKPPNPDLWPRCAADFKDNPDVFFAVTTGPIAEQVEAIRRAGARQPIVVRGAPELETHDSAIVYETAPSYAAIRTGQDRWTQFGQLAERVPVLVNGLDPQFDQDSAECAAFPHDPAEASSLVEDNLTYFDTHSISWTISSLVPGRLVSDYRYFTWTKLDDGWTCGESPSRDGIAMVLLSHLWNADPHGLFAVSQTSGGFLMARGSTATAYGPILADREMSGGKPWTKTLGNISVRVTDSRGVARLAPLLHTGGGWAQVTFIVPDDTAPGPAEVAVVRTDGTSSAAWVAIEDVVPGIWSASQDGRGPAIGWVRQALPDGRTLETPSWKCSGYECRTAPIPLGNGASTTVRLEGTGFRHADPHARVRVTVGGMAVPVESFGPLPDMGRDQVTIRLPGELKGKGEMDLVMTVNGMPSNVVRIRCGTL
jgi:uncharacterized protein (TIGR03437 family)